MKDMSENERVARAMMATGRYFTATELREQLGLTVEKAAATLGAIRRCKRYITQVIGSPRHYKVKVLKVLPSPTWHCGEVAPPELTDRQRQQIHYLSSVVFKPSRGIA
ncbi:hypothetical protein PVT67_15460 [Gallaecimonas kandeliae]|uniref:hypothetical protein n=1 Tax=Gallaecimonas kandeliae TaxID=3029055 RepID=UPI002648BC63|nr:hypothetical protein [Gallaecimonas kandeliae]WKE65041.1 hypothetical protein PVT67_15460 [Gallaecimonas kandeliae]